MVMRGQEGVCMCFSVCTHAICANQFLSSVHLVFTSTYGTLTARLTHTTYTYTNIHVLIGLLYCTVTNVILTDYRVEAQCERTSDSSLSNEKHHPGPAPVSDC